MPSSLIEHGLVNAMTESASDAKNKNDNNLIDANSNNKAVSIASAANVAGNNNNSNNSSSSNNNNNTINNNTSLVTVSSSQISSKVKSCVERSIQSLRVGYTSVYLKANYDFNILMRLAKTELELASMQLIAHLPESSLGEVAEKMRVNLWISI